MSTTVEKYREIQSQYQNQANSAGADTSTLAGAKQTKAQSNADATQNLINKYLDSSSRAYSAKAQAYLNQQKALQSMNMVNPSGATESSRNQIFGTYQNAVNSANAGMVSENESAYDTYQNALNANNDTYNASVSAIQQENAQNISAKMNQFANNQTKLDEYKNELENLIASGEISRSQRNEILNQYEGFTLANDLQKYGATDTTPVDFNTILVNATYKGDGDIEMLKEVVRNNVDFSLVKDGTIIDFNYGKGKDLYVVYNGQLYKADGKASGKTSEAQHRYNISDFVDKYKNLDKNVRKDVTSGSNALMSAYDPSASVDKNTNVQGQEKVENPNTYEVNGKTYTKRETINNSSSLAKTLTKKYGTEEVGVVRKGLGSTAYAYVVFDGRNWIELKKA